MLYRGKVAHKIHTALFDHVDNAANAYRELILLKSVQHKNVGCFATTHGLRSRSLPSTMFSPSPILSKPLTNLHS